MMAAVSVTAAKVCSPSLYFPLSSSFHGTFSSPVLTDALRVNQIGLTTKKAKPKQAKPAKRALVPARDREAEPEEHVTSEHVQPVEVFVDNVAYIVDANVH